MSPEAALAKTSLESAEEVVGPALPLHVHPRSRRARDRVWPRSAAGATRAPRRRSTARSSSSRSTRCAPIIFRPTATRRRNTRDRRAGRRRHRLRARVFARAADAARARVAADRPAAVRDRRARQRRLHGQARRAAARRDARDRGYATARRRVVVPRSAQGHRHRPGLHVLRRRAAGASPDEPASGVCARRRGVRTRSPSAGSTGRHRRARSCSFTWTNRTLPHALRTAIRRRDAYDGEVADADEIVGRLVRYLKAHQLYDQSTIILVGRSRRGPGRSRRAGTACSSTTTRCACR